MYYYYIKLDVPKFNKKKNDEGDKPKVIRGLAGKADCNTWSWGTILRI